jgi:signal peptidase I
MKNKIKNIVTEIFPVAVASAFIGVLFTAVLQVGTLKTDAMTPDIQKDSFVVGNKLAYVTKAPEEGDVVMVHTGDDYLIRTVTTADDGTYTLKDNSDNTIIASADDIIAKVL